MTEKKNDDSLLDNIKAAGSTIGDVVSDFAGRVREDRTQQAGAADHETLMERLRTAASEARERLSNAHGADDIKAAAGDFSSRAEEIVRDLFGSLRRAASETRESEAYTEAKGFVSETVGSVRGSVDEAVTKVRSQQADKPEEQAKADEANSDAANRLDDLMNNLRGDADDKVKNQDDIIDGEVVSDDDATDQK